MNLNYPRVVAHRGAGHLAPENTLSALLIGAAFGQKMVEVDVQLSADGQVFLLHDATLERTTNGHGIAAQQPWKALSRLDAGSWFDERFDEETLPTLQEALQVCIENGLDINIELKPDAGREAELAAAVLKVCRQYWPDTAPRKPLLSSFSVVAMEALRDVGAEFPRAYLVADTVTPETLASATALDVQFLDIGHAALTPDTLAQLRNAHLAVMAWTINDPEQAHHYWAQGVAMICTDAIDLIQP